MLETTFIGHQGWQFATASARILFDPLLVEPFGHNGGVGVVYPPRQLDVAAMPPIDAVFLSHEHEDHFNIPSVNRISREVPVYVPERSSLAMRQFLQEMGFTVIPVSAGQTIKIADLQITCFTPDHVRHDEQDEWETMPFLIQDTIDGGSFFSPVDVTVSEAIEAQLQQRGAAASMWGYANNTLNLSFQEQPPRPAPTMQPIVARFVAEHRRRARPPVASLMCGGGFSFTGPRAWMNSVCFPLDSDELFEGLQTVIPTERFIVPRPGMQIISDRNGVRDVIERSPWLGVLPKDQWPSHAYRPSTTPPEGVSPASGRAELAPGELQELGERLNTFAEFLYGGSLFRALYSLMAANLSPGMKAKFAIAAMSGNADHVFEYDPSGARFMLLQKPEPISGYAAGFECHATDLLDFLRGRLAPSALIFGRILRWRGASDYTTAAIDRAIWLYGHPLRRQAQYLELYRSIYAAEPANAQRVLARSQKARS